MKSWLFVFFLGLYIAPVFANDSAARLAAGGVILEKNEKIQLVSEDLMVSLDEVSVNYIFKNSSPTNVRLKMAFPLPGISAAQLSQYRSQKARKDPLVSFYTSVNGEPVNATEVVDILAPDGRVITDSFLREGLPLSLDSSIYERVAFNTEAVTGSAPFKQRLQNLGLLGPSGEPLWSVRVSYVWDIEFPAHSQLDVSHNYQPITGAFLLHQREAVNRLSDQYCADQVLLEKIRNLPVDVQASTFARELEYVLETAKGWAGPIEEFQLEVHLPDDQYRLASCWPSGLRRKSPTVFEFSASNYIPDENLSLALIPVPGNDEAYGSDPLSLVERIYQQPTPYFEAFYEPGVRRDFYTPETVAMIERKERCFRERYSMSHLDFDYIVPGNDGVFEDLDLRLVEETSEEAKVEVFLIIGSEPVRLEYFLKKISGQWLIHDTRMMQSSLRNDLSSPQC